MKVVAYNEARTVPATMRERSHDDMAIEHDGRFTPGIRVKVLLDSGAERGALLRWPQ